MKSISAKRIFISMCTVIMLCVHAFGSNPVEKVAAQVVQPRVVGVEGQKYTAGDWVILEVDQPQECKECVPQMHLELEKGPLKWGAGRILRWKKTENGGIQVILTSYAPGSFEIPPIVFVEKNGSPSEPLFETEPLTVQFEKVEGDKKQDELYGPSKIPLPKWVVEGSIFFTLLLLAAVFILVKKTRRGKHLVVSQNPKTPFEEFEHVRKTLHDHGLIEKGQFKKLYFGLSEAAKKFLSKAYHIEAEDKTTRELVELMAEYKAVSIFTEQMISQWRAIFEEMDLVKFTDISPTPEQSNNVVAKLATLVAAAWKLSPVQQETMKPKSKYIKP